MQYVNDVISGIAVKIKNPIIDISSDFAIIILILILKYIVIVITNCLFGNPPLVIQVVEILSSGIIISILIGRLIEVIIDIYLTISLKFQNKQSDETDIMNEKEFLKLYKLIISPNANG